MEQKSYYAIIPANVRYDENLKDKAKLLYGEITALCNEKGYCWATNEYFAKLYKVNKTTISKLIKNLIESGYITSKIIYKEGTKEIDKRYLILSQGGIDQIANRGIDQIAKENTTYYNNTMNNKEKEINKEKENLEENVFEIFDLPRHEYEKALRKELENSNNG